MKLNEYIQSIRVQLTMQPKRADQIVIEIEQHIKDQTKQYLLNGTSVEQAELQACEEFGLPSAVAHRFNKTYQHPLHSFWRVLSVTLVTATVMRILVIMVFQFSEYGRRFALSVGPGFYDRQYIIYSSIGFVLGGLVMAKFIYHFLAPLNISQKVLRLSLLLATIVTTGYQLLFSFIKIAWGAVLNNDIVFALSWYGSSASHGLMAPPFLDPVYVQGIWYYLAINLFYLTVTSVVLVVTMQLLFWLLQKRSHKNRFNIIS